MSTPETQSIDRLFLELSQFTTATTRRELIMEQALNSIVEEPENPEGATSMKLRLIAKEALRQTRKP